MNISAEFNGPDHLALIQCRHGMFLCNRNDLIGLYLSLHGEFAEPEVELLSSLIHPGDTVIDVGANIGTLAVPLAGRLGPRGTMLCFEPQRYIHQMLCANLVMNGATNAFAFQVALDEKPGSVDFSEPDYRAGGNFGAVSLVSSETLPPRAAPFDGLAPGRISCLRLDDAVIGLSGLRLIKVDVEGMEAAVLRGAASLIGRFRPIIYCEMNRADTAPDLAATIRRFGYDIYWHAFRGFNPANFRGSPINFGGTFGDVNVVCFPREAGRQLSLPPMNEFSEIRSLMPGIIP